MARKKTETEPTFIPEIPAQMEENIIAPYEPSSVLDKIDIKIEQNQEIDVVQQMIEERINKEEKESDEILFLRSILKKQHDGGFGRHLDEMINNRIKELKSK